MSELEQPRVNTFAQCFTQQHRILTRILLVGSPKLRLLGLCDTMSNLFK